MVEDKINSQGVDLSSIVEDVFAYIGLLCEAKRDVSKRIPVARYIMVDYELTPRQTVECFRRVEERYEEELYCMGWRRFVKWKKDKYEPTKGGLFG